MESINLGEIRSIMPIAVADLYAESIASNIRSTELSAEGCEYTRVVEHLTEVGALIERVRQVIHSQFKSGRMTYGEEDEYVHKLYTFVDTALANRIQDILMSKCSCREMERSSHG